MLARLMATGPLTCLALRYRRNDYSVPTSFGHREVMVRGYVHEVVIACGTEVIARHPRSYEREDFVFDPLHYLALIEQTTHWTRQPPWPAGSCLRSSPRCASCWKPAWANRTSASSSRCCA